MMVGEVSSSCSDAPSTSSYFPPPDIRSAPALFNGESGSWDDYFGSPDGSVRSRQKWSEGPSSAAGSDFSSSTQRYAGHIHIQHEHLQEYGHPMMNRTAVELLSPAISNSHDALHLLSEAAGRTEDFNRRVNADQGYFKRTDSLNTSISESPLLSNASGSTSRPFTRAPRPAGTATMREGYYQDMPSSYSSVESQPPSFRARTTSSDDSGHADAVKVWSRLRFVRAGWLTVEEAMAYVA